MLLAVCAASAQLSKSGSYRNPLFFSGVLTPLTATCAILKQSDHRRHDVINLISVHQGKVIHRNCFWLWLPCLYASAECWCPHLAVAAGGTRPCLGPRPPRVRVQLADRGRPGGGGGQACLGRCQARAGCVQEGRLGGPAGQQLRAALAIPCWKYSPHLNMRTDPSGSPLCIVFQNCRHCLQAFSDYGVEF